MELQVKPNLGASGQENQGTGLRDIFDILVKEPPERLLSLMVHLGDSPEENIIHVLCLTILHRDERALNKLQSLKDSCLVKHLAKSLKMSEGNKEEFGVCCGAFQELTGDSLAVLARIFKVLSEQRLCDPLRRNLAYQRALSMDSQTTSHCENLQYHLLREEAKGVCGPMLEERISSQQDHKSDSCHDPRQRTDEVQTNLRIAEQSEKDFNHASPLQAPPSMPSYPTHLEISIPSTIPYQEDETSPETQDKAEQNSSVFLTTSSQLLDGSQVDSAEPKRDSKMAAAYRKLDNHMVQPETTKPSSAPKDVPSTPTNTFSTEVPDGDRMLESNDAEDEEEETFYAFVILHAQEDVDVAESMKIKMEMVTGLEGATFSEDFAIPGRRTLQCVEDAISNSAFTFLLLTRNYNTRLLDMKTDTAIMHSINNKYKHNTVIPLLPLENSMPETSLPMVLNALVYLKENRNFEHKVKKVLTPANFRKQLRIWREEQRVKREKKRQDELRRSNQCQRQFLKEHRMVKSLIRDNINLAMAQKCILNPSVPAGQGSGDGQAIWQQPNIHIENAQYIMIGNDSQMTVEHSGGSEREDSVF